MKTATRLSGYGLALVVIAGGAWAVGTAVGPVGPRERFAVTVPTAGRYRLFLDFQHDGRVHTAESTLEGVA